jgi:hypothetical protein
MFLPDERISRLIFSFAPFPIASMAIIDATPILMPRVVRRERPLWCIIDLIDVLKSCCTFISFTERP